MRLGGTSSGSSRGAAFTLPQRGAGRRAAAGWGARLRTAVDYWLGLSPHPGSSIRPSPRWGRVGLRRYFQTQAAKLDIAKTINLSSPGTALTLPQGGEGRRAAAGWGALRRSSVDYWLGLSPPPGSSIRPSPRRGRVGLRPYFPMEGVDSHADEKKDRPTLAAVLTLPQGGEGRRAAAGWGANPQPCSTTGVRT